MAKITTDLFGDLAFIPFQAQSPAKETLEFLTDLIVSVDGTEQAIPLRNSARRLLSYSIPVQAVDDPTVYNTVYGAIRDRWAIPMWTEGQYIGTVAGSLTTLPCDTIYHDLRASSLAILWSSNLVWQILEITTKTNTSISLAHATVAQTGAFLLPLRVGFIDGSVERPTSGYGSAFNIRYNIEEIATFSAGAPAQYLSNDIYYDVPLLNDDTLTTALQKQYDTIDFDLGLVNYRTQVIDTQFVSVFSAICDTLAEIYNYKYFLFRRQGKYRRFWLPSFENNLRIKNTGTVASTLIAYRDSYDYLEQRTHVAIEAAGVWYPRALSGTTYTDATTVQFTLSSALSIPAESINRVCWLGLYRLDGDTVELNWIGNNVLDSQVRMVELTP